MVFPLLPLIASGALSAFGGYVAKDMLTDSKKSAGIIHEAPFHNFSPTTRTDSTKIFAPQYAIQYPSYTIISGSPGAISETKKSISQKYIPEYDFQRREAPMSGAGSGLGGNDISKIILPVAVVGGLAYVGSAYLGKKGGK